MSPEPTPTERKTSAWEHATRLVTEACTPGPVAAGDILAVANWLMATGDQTNRPTLRIGDAVFDIVPDPTPAPIVYDITLDAKKIVDAIKRRDDGQARR